MPDEGVTFLISVVTTLLKPMNPEGPLTTARLLLGAPVHFDASAHETAITRPEW